MTNPNDSIRPTRDAVEVCEDGRIIANIPGSPGLTKREHFAALAMQGLLSNPAITSAFTNRALIDLADNAANAADALIAELNKEGK